MSLDRRSFLRRRRRCSARAAHAVRAGRHRAPLRLHHPARRGRRPEHRHPVRAIRPMRSLRGALADRSGRRTEAGRHVRAASRRWRNCATCTRRGQARFFHAVASPYRDRSHFDGQNVLETGGARRYQLQGRLDEPAGRPAAARRQGRRSPSRRPCRWRCAAPSRSPPMRRRRCRRRNEDLLHARRAALCRATRSCTRCGRRRSRRAAWPAACGGGANRQDPAALGRMAAGFLARADGPRIAMIETGGWDTHSGQNARLAGQLRGLDAPDRRRCTTGWAPPGRRPWSWSPPSSAAPSRPTAPAAPTTARRGGDAGSAARCRAAASSPTGRASRRPACYEGRDLKPTLALDALVAAACAESFGLEPDRLARVLFPNSARGKPLPRLLRA